MRDIGKMPSMIQANDGEASFFQNSHSFVFAMEENKEDDYNDDEDAGFEIFVVNEENFVASCKELAGQFNFPTRSIKPDTKESQVQRQKKQKKDESAMYSQDEFDEDDGRKVSVLPKWIKFMPSNDEFYPAEFDNVIYDCYNLRVVFDREKTGFEETKEFPIVINSIVAGRY